MKPSMAYPRLPIISILHTGGTIASKVDYETGGVIAKFKPAELVAMFPELRGIANIRCELLGNIMSENMRFGHYNAIAKAIGQDIRKGTDGIIVTHGTDTMHYTSAALSFMLENLPVPVILVGAQRSSDRGSSDAALNLISAAYFIANSDFAEVGICMHESMNDTSCVILPGTKARKMHTSRRDAFKAINALPKARVTLSKEHSKKKIEFLSGYVSKKDRAGKKLRLTLMDDRVRVGFLKSHPQMFASEFLAYRAFDGLVVEGTGLGHLPILETDRLTAEHKRIAAAIRELAKKTVVVMAAQTIHGRIHMDVYAVQRKIRELGVLGHLSDMTPETAFVKLAWLLSNHSREEAARLIGKDFCGEISERSVVAEID